MPSARRAHLLILQARQPCSSRPCRPPASPTTWTRPWPPPGARHNAWLLGHATRHRGVVWWALTGNTAGARADLDQAAAVATASGHDVLLAQAVGHLATLDLLDGHLDESLHRLRLQLEHLRRAGNLEGLATALDITAALAAQQQRWRRRPGPRPSRRSCAGGSGWPPAR
jgi:hypothetical protein